MKYFAMLDSEAVVLLPGATTFEDADEIAPPNTHWIFHEEGLRDFITSAQEAIKETT